MCVWRRGGGGLSIQKLETNSCQTITFQPPPPHTHTLPELLQRGCPALSSQPPPPLQHNSVCWGLPPQVSETFLSSSCQSLSSLTQALIPLSSRCLAPLLPSLPPFTHSFLSPSLSFLGWSAHTDCSRLVCRAPYLAADLWACLHAVRLSLCHTHTHTHTFLHQSFCWFYKYEQLVRPLNLRGFGIVKKIKLEEEVTEGKFKAQHQRHITKVGFEGLCVCVCVCVCVCCWMDILKESETCSHLLLCPIWPSPPL